MTLFTNLLWAIVRIGVLLYVPAAGQVRVPGPGGGSSNAAPGACKPVSGYAHCRVLTIDHTQAGGSTLTNFPVFVSLSLGASRITNANCFDVVFTSDSSGSALLPWEQEQGLCNAATGAYGAWVLTSSVLSSMDTSLYVSYDNGSVSTAQNTGSNGPANVWDANFRAVYHLPNGTTLSANDSTSFATNGTVVGSPGAVTGRIGGGLGLSGNESNYVNSNLSGPAFTSKITASFWAYASSHPVQCAVSNMNYGTGSPLDETLSFFDNAGTYWARVVTTNGMQTLSGGALPLSTWTKVDIVYDGANMYLYADGSPLASGSLTGNLVSTAVPLYLGRRGQSDAYSISSWPWNGSLDEFRLSVIDRPAGWIAAEYNNQKPASTFLIVGSEI